MVLHLTQSSFFSSLSAPVAHLNSEADSIRALCPTLTKFSILLIAGIIEDGQNLSEPRVFDRFIKKALDLLDKPVCCEPGVGCQRASFCANGQSLSQMKRTPGKRQLGRHVASQGSHFSVCWTYQLNSLVLWAKNKTCFEIHLIWLSAIYNRIQTSTLSHEKSPTVVLLFYQTSLPLPFVGTQRNV